MDSHSVRSAGRILHMKWDLRMPESCAVSISIPQPDPAPQIFAGSRFHWAHHHRFSSRPKFRRNKHLNHFSIDQIERFVPHLCLIRIGSYSLCAIHPYKWKPLTRWNSEQNEPSGLADCSSGLPVGPSPNADWLIGCILHPWYFVKPKIYWLRLDWPIHHIHKTLVGTEDYCRPLWPKKQLFSAFSHPLQEHLRLPESKHKRSYR